MIYMQLTATHASFCVCIWRCRFFVKFSTYLVWRRDFRQELSLRRWWCNRVEAVDRPSHSQWLHLQRYCALWICSIAMFGTTFSSVPHSLDQFKAITNKLPNSNLSSICMSLKNAAAAAAAATCTHTLTCNMPNLQLHARPNRFVNQCLICIIK